MTAWPATLPQTLTADSYQESMQDGTVRTQMESGPVNVRRRFSAITRYVGGDMIMSDTQWATLYTFYATTMAGGVGTFTGDLAGAGGSLTMRFASPPVRRPLGRRDLWQVTLSFEVLP